MYPFIQKDYVKVLRKVIFYRCIFTIFCYKQFHCSQIPQLPNIHTNTPRCFFARHQDFIEYQKELNQAYSDIEKIRLQNMKTLETIQKISLSFENNNSKTIQKLLTDIKDITHTVSLLSMQTTNPAWLKKRQDHLHSISELTSIIKNLHQKANELRFIKTICRYHMPIKNSPRK